MADESSQKKTDRWGKLFASAVVRVQGCGKDHSAFCHIDKQFVKAV